MGVAYNLRSYQSFLT